MNKTYKPIIIIVFLIIITGGLFFFFKPENNNLTSELFTIKDTSEVYKVIISKDTLKVKLTKNKETGTWTVNNKYPANKKSIKRLYQTLTESKINKPVLSTNADSLLKILKTESEEITLYNSDGKPIKTLFSGSSDKEIGGTYMLNQENNTPFIVNIPGVENDLNYRYNINASYWMERIIFSYRPNEIKEVVLIYPDNMSKSFRLEISGDSAHVFNINNNKDISNIDLQKTGAYLSYFMNVSFSDETFDTEILKNQLIKNKPFVDLIVKDINGRSKNIRLYKIPDKKEKNAYNLNFLYAVINNKDVVIVKYTDFDLILKDINYFAKRNM